MYNRHNTNNTYNTYNTHNTYNNHFQDHRMFSSSTQRRTWTQCLFKQRLRTGAILEYYSSIPNGFRRHNCHNKCSIVDPPRPNHDRVQSVTAVNRFCRKRVAVYPLHTRVLGVSQHQKIVKSEMTLVSG
jgi:hypothetical protein